MVLLGFDGYGSDEPSIQIILLCDWEQLRVSSQVNANSKPYVRGQQKPRHNSQKLFTKLGEHFMAITGTEWTENLAKYITRSH